MRSLATLRPTALARRYAAVIFDKDGTLLDFAATWDRGIAEALSRVAADKRRLAAEALGFDLDAGRALRDAACVHLPNEVLVTMLEPITDARTLLNDAAATAAKHATAAAHADDVLRALRVNSIPVAVATNDDEQPARNALRALGWARAGTHRASKPARAAWTTLTTSWRLHWAAPPGQQPASPD